jgi:hypothetical protein
MMNGQALDLFGAGRHTLETENIPFLSRLLNRVTGNDTSPFHAEVYFINKTEQMAIKWGTDSKVQFIEPTYGFPLQIGACGEMSLRAEDSRKLLLKLVGTENSLTQAKLTQYFRAVLMTKVKSYLAQIIKDKSINIFEIDEHLSEISTTLHAMLKPDFADYGVVLERFFVTTILKPDGDSSYEKFKSLHFRQYSDIAEAKLRQQVGIIDQQTEAQKLVIQSQAIAQKRAQEGYTYQQERGFDVAQTIANNDSVSQFTNLGVGLGTMAGIGGTMASMVGGSMNDAMQSLNQSPTVNVQPQVTTSVKVCSKCGNPLIEGAKFCLECGEKVVDNSMIICPECGKSVIKGKFCPECGHKFAPSVCPNCGKPVVDGAKFCLECGQKL